MADENDPWMKCIVEDHTEGRTMTLESVHLNSAMNVVLNFGKDQFFVVSAAGAKILRAALTEAIGEYDEAWKGLE
jgi:acetone carboxylase gamma subunit